MALLQIHRVGDLIYGGNINQVSHQQGNVNNSLYSILLISEYTIIYLHSCYFGFSLFLWLLLIYIDIRRAGQPIPVFLPGESHGQRSLAGYSPWGR